MNTHGIPGLVIGKSIGHGYFGAVFEGQDRLGRRVAVKTYQRKIGESDSDWATRKGRLIQEGQRLREAEHEHVVRVFDVKNSSADDAIVLVMEFCEGGCVGDHYKRGPIPLGELRSILLDTAFGLQALHARGMLHRDIKPSNLLLNRDGRAKLGDFGLVSNEMVYGYALAGTYQYTDHIAPEVASTGLTSERSDLFAYGMTVYRLLHGAGFYATNPRVPGLVRAGGLTRLPWLPHVPKAWRAFVRLLLQPDPNMRMPNAAELIHRIQKLPTEPRWSCEWAPELVRWEQCIRDRKIVVTHELRSPRRQRWGAVAIGRSGQVRRLRGDAGWRSGPPVRRELDEFFTSA